MKNTAILVTFLFFSFGVFGQDSSLQKNITVKWAPTGLLLGSASLQAEYNFGGRNSLTAKLGLPIKAKRTFQYENEDARFTMKATSFLAGYRTYFSRQKHLRGLYYEPFFKYVYHVSEGMGTGTLDSRQATYNLMNTYSGVGLGIQLGAQFFIGKRFVIDFFFLGPEVNSASNTFKAVEVLNNTPWTAWEAERAADDIREFLGKFPVIGDKVKVMADRENKRVTAHYKGILPGIRTGVSFGFAF